MSQNFTLIMERRRLAALDAQAEVLANNLNIEDANRYLFEADSNAIWDAQQGRPYRKFEYVVKPVVNYPKYTELGLLSDEKKAALGLK